jgi:hypothetical protein
MSNKKLVLIIVGVIGLVLAIPLLLMIAGALFYYMTGK